MGLEEEIQKTALTIAGSDPSGGAGIQADIKTFTVLGVYGGAVITSLTAQNTQGVFSVEPVAPSFVKEQIDYVLKDLNVTHIKIGMVGTVPIIESICEQLCSFAGEIIYDPILISSSGHYLMDQNGYDAVRQLLLDICTVVTPNLPELPVLSERKCGTHNEIFSAAEHLLNKHEKLRAVIIKGGHSQPDEKMVDDFLVKLADQEKKAEVIKESHPRLDTRNTHGTGCTFSAAFAAYHLLTGSDTIAFRKTVSFMDELLTLSAASDIGCGTGPLVHHLVLKG
jgi:hydroxymethylpyrimidine/phosphomethylpyrimidine kinase